MPIRQLREKSNNNSGFSTRSFGPGAIRNAVPTQQEPVRRETPARSEPKNNAHMSLRGSKKPQSAKRRFAMNLLRFGLIIFFIGGIFIVSVFAWYSKDLPDPNKIIQRDIAQSTKIYDRTGKILLYEIHGTERRTLIELSDIPQYAIDAAIAIEDKNFYKHGALSLPSIAKAVVLDVASRIGLYHGLVPGGSTLTQQFIKNAVLTNEKSYVRKIKEFVLAYRLEQKFTKDQILKMYFNEIPYGSTAYGIEAASHIYFDKAAKDLTLGEAAILAAMPQAPSYYSPSGPHRDELIGRQRYILKLMVEQRYVTQEQANQARDEKIAFKTRREDIKAPHFVFMVKDELGQRYGERLVEQGGLKIITSLDMNKQKAAEDTINAIAPTNLEKYKAQNASLVTIDTKTGEILALVGSKDYFNDDIDGQVNVAIQPRQPGSSIKPVIYAKAFDLGYRPDTLIFDLVTSFAVSGKQYTPHDYDGKERGPVTLRQALQGSLNIPAVKMLYLVGVNNALDLANQLGYTTFTDPSRYGLSLVLGGAEVKLVEHTNAFATFAREGIAKPYVDVLRVEDASGAVLEEHRDTEGKRVLPREVVRTLSNVLSDNDSRAFIFGAANHLTLSGRPAAVKTGTTNDYHDAWTIGYTPGIATGVWVGNNNNTSMGKGADGSVVAAPIWQKYMETILKDMPAEGFKSPEPLTPCTKPMLCGALGDEQIIKINADNNKLASPYTPPAKIKEITIREVHSLLHYVNKDDPTGPAPADPNADPQYPLWEGPVQKWSAAQGFQSQQVPTEVDDTYRAEDQPNIAWASPRDGDTITGSSYTFTVQTSGPHGISKVEYYLNKTLIGTSTQFPFSFTFAPSPASPNGTYTLAAVASDAAGNAKSADISISLNVARNSEWHLLWSDPINGQVYTQTTLPENLRLTLNNPQQIKKIDFFYKMNGGPNYVGYQNINGQTDIIQAWAKPSVAGDYSLYTVVTDTANQTYTIPGISFTLLASAP